MNYGKAIRIARVAKGLSQKQLGKLINVDASYISRLEAGTREPSAETLKELSRELSIPLVLLTFLGADSEDLKGITPEIAAQLGKHLIDIMSQAEVEAK